MRCVSMSVPEGDLAVEVVPRSRRDTLATAFLRMSHGLQELVRTTRDSAGQVSAGSNQVAGASDESAKVSVQASSAIEEVTSTMHEMRDRKSTRLNSSHLVISYAVFCLKKKKHANSHATRHHTRAARIPRKRS